MDVHDTKRGHWLAAFCLAVVVYDRDCGLTYLPGIHLDDMVP